MDEMCSTKLACSQNEGWELVIAERRKHGAF